jgi:hypothetical protein
MYYKVTMLKLSLTKLVPWIIAITASGGVATKKHDVLPETHPVMIRADARAAEIISVVEEMVSDPVQQETWERALFGWEYWESSWFIKPPGYNDNGAAHCSLQLHNEVINTVPGATSASVEKDPKLCVRVALTYLLEREKTCGSKAAAWTAFSWDGACHSQTLDLVKNRCRYVGLTGTCEMPPPKAAPAPSISASVKK